MVEEQGVTCWGCGGALPVAGLGRRDQCPHCGRDVRVCRNCRHYAPGHYNDCRESQAERVVDKERGNFCDFFQPRQGAATTAQASLDPRAAAAALFRK